MPSDDDGLAPTEGPDWENGFSDSLRNFEEAVTLWRRREEATCEEKIAGRNLNQRTVASCDFTAEDCLKAHFPDREDDESDAPLQALVKVAKSQREELQEVLELVRNHAERFEGHSSLTAQLPEQGSASARKSGADVVALLAELLDVASRNFSKQRGKEEGCRGMTGVKNGMDEDVRSTVFENGVKCGRMTTAEMTGVVRKMSVTRMIDVERAMAQAAMMDVVVIVTAARMTMIIDAMSGVMMTGMKMIVEDVKAVMTGVIIGPRMTTVATIAEMIVTMIGDPQVRDVRSGQDLAAEVMQLRDHRKQHPLTRHNNYFRQIFIDHEIDGEYQNIS
eukprot:s711_g7.t1